MFDLEVVYRLVSPFVWPNGENFGEIGVKKLFNCRRMMQFSDILYTHLKAVTNLCEGYKYVLTNCNFVDLIARHLIKFKLSTHHSMEL